MAALRGVYTIDPVRPFADSLAAGLTARVRPDDGAALARTTVLLPTRRACRSLREAFLRQSRGRAVLLPRLLPLGEMDEEEASLDESLAETAAVLAPAITPLARQVLLTRLILARADAPAPDQAARLAAELGRLIDAIHIEELDPARLDDLVREDFGESEHWRRTVRFLALITEHWPRIKAERGVLDPAERRRLLLDAQAEAWRAAPPDAPVVAAGSTGSVPATARLIAVVAGLPQGCVVLPGLDPVLDAPAWEALDETHPQFTMKRLLERLGVARESVPDWPVPSDGSVPEDSDLGPAPGSRMRLIGEAMRPAAVTDAWRSLAPVPKQALEGVRMIEAEDARQEALAVALVLRETLETPARTAALVTPDRALARRVAAELARWSVEVDDSGGLALALSPPGVFLRLCAQAAAEGFAPVALLALLKHPLAAGGQDPAVFRARARLLERLVLRGVRPASGLAGLTAALESVEGLDEEVHARLGGWLERLAKTANPFAEAFTAPETAAADLVESHMRFAESLAASRDLPGPARLWRGEAGEAAARFAADLWEAAADLPPLRGGVYPALLDALMAASVVRPAHGAHPRLAILGPLEARLQQPDVMVLSGLNEGCWPPETEVDPWMSRPMRARFGLPAPERRIGLSAHDFAQGFCAPHVVLTRARRSEGSPAVPSRWLLRLDTVLKAANGEKAGLSARTGPWAHWARLLDRPETVEPVRPPAPRPPVAARPRKLYATQIEAWMRNPYAVYARHVLGLRALEPLDADPGAADYGTLIHAVLERFNRAWPGPLPKDALERLVETGRDAFAPLLSRPGVRAFWWPRFLRIAEWLTGHDGPRRTKGVSVIVEAEGMLEIKAPAGPFILGAKADRIDVAADGGPLTIIDYKTGAPPKAREVLAGFAPQLPLEAAIAQAGGFVGVPAASVGALLYWRLHGGAGGGEESRAGGGGADPAALAAQAREGLETLVAAFDDPATPYEARPYPEMAPRFDDYEHLARVREWAALEEGED